MSSSSRGWWREKFIDHPLIHDKSRRHEARTTPDSGDKTRCICVECFPFHVQERQLSDELKFRENSRFPRRTREEIISDMWATPADARHERCWLASHTTTLLNHLRNCDRVPRNVREDAAAKLGKPLQLAPSQLTTPPPSSLPSIGPQSSSSICRPPLATSMVSNPTLSSLSSATLVASDSEAPFPGLVHPYAERTIMPQLGYGAAVPQVPRNQRRALARVPSLAQPPPWTSETQRRFESRIARVTASANIPLSWVDDPEVQAFFADFIPAARPISRRVLTSRLLPTELDAQRAVLLPRIEGGEATLQCDGWSAGNFHHYTGFTLTVKKEVVIVALEDNSAERKTGNNLLRMIIEKISVAENELGVQVVAFVSDDGGDARYARRMLIPRRPDLIVIPCSAHQTILIVSDYFKCDAEIFVYSTQADLAITWLRSKTFVLGLLRDIQQRLDPNGIPLTVIRAVITRWTSHFLAYRRLLDLRYPIMAMLNQDSKLPESQIITGNSKAKAKAREMISYLKDDDFWRALSRIKSHLQPFAYAANITQSDAARLDTVLLVWGLLYRYFDNLPSSDASDKQIAEAVCISINRRWEASDQDVYIAAIILNPAHKTRPFAKSSWSSAALITILMCRLWRRFFGDSDSFDADLSQEVLDYLGDSGSYRDMPGFWIRHVQNRQAASLPSDPLQYWQAIGIAHDGTWISSLPRLAKRLLSVCPNSASCERLFSLLKRTMTPARSRLTGDNLLRIAELHAHLKETHKKSGLSTQRLRRELNPSSQTLDSLMPQLPQAATLSSDNAGSDSASQLTPSLAALSLTSLSSSPTVVDEREEIQIDSDTSGDSDKEADDDECEADSDRGNDVRTLADIARSLIELADESERIVADLAPRTTTHSHRTFESGSTGLPDRPFRFDITEIFNFRETYWFDAIEQQAESGLASETDLCEYFESNGTDTMTDM